MVSVGIKESSEDEEIALADFAQHPTHRFVDQVVGVGEQNGGERERVFKLVIADKGKSGEDSYTTLPKIFGLG